MAKSAILSVRILADAQDAVRGFQRTSTAAKLLDDAMNVARVGIMATGAAVTAFTVGAVNDAAALEQSSGAVNAVFGEQSAAMEEMANSAATNLGLTKNEFNELGTLIGSQLKNGGTAMEELAPKTGELITMGADLAAMFGGTTADAVGALSSALKGERDPIERYGVSLNQAAIDAKAAEMGFEKVGGALSAEANQAATLALIMEQTSAAHGAFARETDTLATQQQILKAQWGDLSAQVGTYLLPSLTGLVSWANSEMMPWLGGMATKIPEAAGAVTNLAQTVSGNLTTAFQQNQPVIMGVATIIGILLIPAFIRLGATATVAALAQVAGWGLAGAKAVATGVIYAVTAPKIIANWFAMGLAAIRSGAQTAAIWLMYQVDAAKAVAAHLMARAQIVAGWFAMGLAAIRSGAQTAAIWLMYKIEAAKSASAMAANAARIVAGWVLMGAQSLLQAARMAAAWFIALGPIGWAIAAIIGIVAVVVANWDKIVAFTKAAWSTVSQWVTDKAAAARDFVVNAWTAVKDWTSNAFDTAKAAVVDAMVRIVSSVQEKGAAVLQWFRDLPGAIRDKLTGMADTLKTIGSQMIEGLIGGVKQKASAVVDSVKGTITDAIDGAKKLLGIQSPSRLFRNEIGAQIGAGLAIGIEGTKGDVLKATREMLHIPEVEAKALASRPVELTAAYAPTATSPSGAGQTVNLTVHIDGVGFDRRKAADELVELVRDRLKIRGEALA
ncbi:phage tail protein [Rothia sp. L_38]|uniref:phage tail protein n=1 Tax=Rothia sp. L_38 TaxID=3422315 RepID=UPI003D6BDEF6